MPEFVPIGNSNYDECESPVCPDSIEVRILTYPIRVCEGDELTISWTIDGIVEGQYISFNAILWSFNDQTFDNTSHSINSNSPYYTTFTAPMGGGTIFFKARAIINGTFYESDIKSIPVIEDCEPDEIFYIVPTKYCECNIDPQPANLPWVKEDGVPKVLDPLGGIQPVYFMWETYCLYVDQDSLDNKILYNLDFSYEVLDSISNQYSDCEDCCEGGCDFEEDASGGSNEGFHKVYNIGNENCILLKYQTYTIPDHVIVSDYETGQILHDSGCIGTNGWDVVEIDTTDVHLIDFLIIGSCSNSEDYTWWQFEVNCCETSSSSGSLSSSSSSLSSSSSSLSSSHSSSSHSSSSHSSSSQSSSTGSSSSSLSSSSHSSSSHSSSSHSSSSHSSSSTSSASSSSHSSSSTSSSSHSSASCNPSIECCTGIVSGLDGTVDLCNCINCTLHCDDYVWCLAVYAGVYCCYCWSYWSSGISGGCSCDAGGPMGWTLTCKDLYNSGNSCPDGPNDCPARGDMTCF